MSFFRQIGPSQRSMPPKRAGRRWPSESKHSIEARRKAGLERYGTPKNGNYGFLTVPQRMEVGMK